MDQLGKPVSASFSQSTEPPKCGFIPPVCDPDSVGVGGCGCYCTKCELGYTHCGDVGTGCKQTV